jgi:tetratricopeptide (TPR) repeat protein
MPISLRSLPSTALCGIAAAVLALSACAPRTAGLEARREADERFRRTTSLVSFDQAKQAFESGDLDKARREIESAIARSDKEARYWTLLGRVEIEASRLERAVEALGKAIESDPALAEPHYYLGIVQQRWGEADKAIASYLMAAELDSARIAYVLAAAELMVAERRLDEARELMLPKLSYFEHNAAFHELIGDISTLKNDDLAAARSYERALAIEPNAPLVGDKALAALFRAGEWQRCLEFARRLREAAVAKADGRVATIPADVLRHEGRSLAMLGRHAEARAVFAEFVRTYPESTEAWRDLAVASLKLNDFDRAGSAADRLIALDQADATGFALRGMVSERSGQLDEAVRWYRSALERDPADADATAALGFALCRSGSKDEGTRYLKQALELDPSFELVAQTLASERQ